MSNLIYRIGGLAINLPKFNNSQLLSYHKFVVGAKDDTLSIYVSDDDFHRKVAHRFRKDGTVLIPIGGGKCYLDKKRKLVLDSNSTEYGAVPRTVAMEFARLLVPELENLGLVITDYTARPRGVLKEFWISRGF